MRSANVSNRTATEPLCTSCTRARSLPPAVVFTAQLEVAQHYGDLCARDHQDDKHQAQEAKQVVELVQPHRCQDEEELDEDRPKRQDPANEDAENGVHIPGLFRNLARDFVGAYWVLIRW